MSRQNYIYAQLALIAGVMAAALFVFRNGVTVDTVQGLLPLIVIAFIPQIIFTIRRLHDMNVSGLWSILILLPYVSLFVAVFIAIKEGTTGTNSYGEPDTRSFIDSILNKIN